MKMVKVKVFIVGAKRFGFYRKNLWIKHNRVSNRHKIIHKQNGSLDASSVKTTPKVIG